MGHWLTHLLLRTLADKPVSCLCMYIIKFFGVTCFQQGHAGSKTLQQQNPPVLNWRCRLTQGLTCIMAVKRWLLLLYCVTLKWWHCVAVLKTNIPDFRNTEMEVFRRFSDFLGLHEKLVEKHLHRGCIIPPPPEKSVIGMLTKNVDNDCNYWCLTVFSNV